MDSFIITTEGRRVEFVPVSQRKIQKRIAKLERDFRAQHPELEPPWYWAIEPDEQGNGGEKVFWDKLSVEKDGNEEERASWVTHELATNQLKALIESESTKMLLLQGIKNEEDRKPTPEWMREQDELGYELPANPDEIALEYIGEEVLKTPKDLLRAIAKATTLSADGALSQEDIQAMEDSFLSALAQVGKRIGAESGLTQNGTESTEEQVRNVELSPPVDGIRSSEVVGDNPA